jgi:hypothetical protein
MGARTLYSAVAIALSCVVAMSTAQVARATDCLVDSAGGAQMAYQYERYLLMHQIHTSLWNADATSGNDYYARRYDSGYNMTLQTYIYNGGSYVYGTPGNALRSTAMTPVWSHGVTGWYEDESQIC